MHITDIIMTVNLYLSKVRKRSCDSPVFNENRVQLVTMVTYSIITITEYATTVTS